MHFQQVGTTQLAQVLMPSGQIQQVQVQTLTPNTAPSGHQTIVIGQNTANIGGNSAGQTIVVQQQPQSVTSSAGNHSTTTTSSQSQAASSSSASHESLLLPQQQQHITIGKRVTVEDLGKNVFITFHFRQQR